MYSLREYIDFTQEIFRERGAYGVYKEGTSYMYESLLRQLRPLLDNEPDYVLDKEWDVLIILDACRVDALEEVADEYEFLPNPPHETVWSADSYSEGWLRENFMGKQALKHRKRMRRLAHISGNPFTDIFDGDEFKVLDEVWKYGWDTETGHMPPEPITDSAISYHRENDPEQMLVHYMQPHAPFVGENATGYEIDVSHFGETAETIGDRTPWELLRDGKMDEDRVWEAYLDTLRVGLDSVETLLKSIDAETVVISADHGNGIGEWGIYGHPRHIPLAPVRQVPWVTTKATDTGEYTPSEKNVEQDSNSVNREEQLKSLGYM